MNHEKRHVETRRRSKLSARLFNRGESWRLREGEAFKKGKVFERQFDWGSNHLKCKDGIQKLNPRGIMIRDDRSGRRSDNSSGYR